MTTALVHLLCRHFPLKAEVKCFAGTFFAGFALTFWELMIFDPVEQEMHGNRAYTGGSRACTSRAAGTMPAPSLHRAGTGGGLDRACIELAPWLSGKEPEPSRHWREPSRHWRGASRHSTEQARWAPAASANLKPMIQQIMIGNRTKGGERGLEFKTVRCMGRCKFL